MGNYYGRRFKKFLANKGRLESPNKETEKKLKGSSVAGLKIIGKKMWSGSKKVAKGTKKGLVFIDKALTGSKGSAWKVLKKKPYKNRTLHIGHTYNGVVRYWESLERKIS